jgi:hypothetical protein
MLGRQSYLNSKILDAFQDLEVKQDSTLELKRAKSKE